LTSCRKHYPQSPAGAVPADAAARYLAKKTTGHPRSCDRLSGQRSWAEIPFGGDHRALELTPEQRARLPWDPLTPVVISGTKLRIGGSIDRIDLTAAGDIAASPTTNPASRRAVAVN